MRYEELRAMKRPFKLAPSLKLVISCRLSWNKNIQTPTTPLYVLEAPNRRAYRTKYAGWTTRHLYGVNSRAHEGANCPS